MNNKFLALRRSLEDSIRLSSAMVEEIKNRAPLVFYIVVRPYLVVFSDVEKSLDSEYDQTVEAMKELYTEHSDEWRHLDLCLVLCLSKPEAANLELRFRIEQDPFFCRKFVVDIGNILRNSLERLPFIPLSRVGSQVSSAYERPVSCQTLLMQLGVSADLARPLVTPSAMGEGTIVDKCLHNGFRKPQFGRLNQSVFEDMQSPVEKKIRVKRLEIQGFRAYEKKAEFDLNADIVVLFGANGLGKTSVFDAIDYCCTGGVGRFDGRYSRMPDRVKVLRNLDSESSRVRLDFGGNGTLDTIERSVGESDALFNDVPMNRTESLLKLTGYKREENDLRLQNLINLFRASHLFGQDYTTLTEELASKSRLSEEIVSRMLAFQDYVQAISKIGKVLDELYRLCRANESEIDELKQSIKSTQQEIQSLSTFEKKASDPNVLAGLRAKLLKAVRMSLRIDWPNNREIDTTILREWRTRLAVEKNKSNQQLKSLKDLETLKPAVLEAKRRIAEITAAINRNRVALRTVEDTSGKKASDVATLSKKANNTVFEIGQLRTQIDGLTWLIDHQPEFFKLRHLIETTRKDLEKESESLDVAKTSLSKLNQTAEQLNQQLNKLDQEIQIQEAKIADLDSFLEYSPQWGAEVETSERIEKELASHQAYVAHLRKNIESVAIQLREATSEFDKNKRHVSLLQESQEDLQNLLDSIKKHVVDEVCPVCGTNHRSTEDLLAKLAARRGTQPKELSIALEKLEVSQSNVKALMEALDEMKNDLGKTEPLLVSANLSLQRTRTRLQKFEQDANTLGLPPRPTDAIAQSRARRNTVTQQLTETLKAREEARELIPEIQSQLSVSFKTKEASEKELVDSRIRLEQTQSELRSIESEATRRGLSFTSDLDAIRANLDVLRNKLSTLNSSNEETQKNLRAAQNEKNELDSEAKRLWAETTQDETLLSQLSDTVSRYEQLLMAVGLTPDQTEVSEKKGQLEKSLSEAAALESEVLSFEVALDASQKSATIAKLQQEVELHTSRIRDIGVSFELAKEWISIFERMLNELELVQKKALLGYTTFFGPLATTIQKRLRPFYGFGDITLNPSKGGIDVRVDRENGIGVSPGDYLSQSQMQIITLSLFLSATITQNWSCFAPILLDDPVTHFDDFNAYSFVDFLRGMVNDPANERQLILSTCEERLFQLIQQKFKGSKGKVVYHLFESIGDSGPRFKTKYN